jgi:hypothetical protein
MRKYVRKHTPISWGMIWPILTAPTRQLRRQDGSQDEAVKSNFTL